MHWRTKDAAMHWRIKLEDDNGHFWLTDKECMWSDSVDDAVIFTHYAKAYHAAEMAKARVAHYKDWFPRVRIVKWTH